MPKSTKLKIIILKYANTFLNKFHFIYEQEYLMTIL